MKRAEFGKEPEDQPKSQPAAPASAGASAVPAAPVPAAPQKAAPQIIAEHTVAAGETLSHIALKYYGSTLREKWMVIYEANQAVIGSNPNILVPGSVLKIPKLPA